ncbi:MAG TPA: asparaginase [Pararhizobium sp.]|nr:asparaginase [Pararhizobium sp.]
MSNPVLVEVTRGHHVESRHRGIVSVVDGDGAQVLSLGEVETPVFPRSAVKAMQALPLVESGAADAYGFSNRELALACSSHSGEPAHVELAAAMLAKAGLDHTALECGSHWSGQQRVLIEQARSGITPTALHNNCSGKHTGFVCTACHLGIDHHGYVGYDHPIQAEIRGVLESLTGASLGTDLCGTDGCSIPTYAIPLDHLAHGFAKMATGTGLGRERATAARRLFAACMAEPFYVAGTGRFCTRLMELAPGRLFAKTGAEGVYCAALPEQGLGIAVKCEDGATRAAEVMVAAVLAKLVEDKELGGRLAALARRPLTNWNGLTVGEIHPTGALAL